ncbi:MAG TPA: nodulation protein NfeD [Candidatus Limnocylindrales bacterium]|nr:nodulation protein NfeD [Candidatus Limnocylindrales bacterium]
MTGHRRRRMLSLLAWVGGLVLLAAGGARGASSSVPVLSATGVVDSVLAGYLADGIARAESSGAPAVVIRINTPGGSLDATQKIVSAELESTIPTIVWVAPAGGRAASAGTFITLAASLAYMAPGTNIGAASPVDSSGNDIPGTLGEKVRNDAIANIRSIAETRGRNVDWAVSTVQDARSSAASEAVSVHAVDGIAGSLDEVAAAANGKTLTLAGRQVTVDLAGASFDEAPMNPLQALLHLLSDPNIAFVLFLIGSYGLIFELAHPNFVTGILGAISLILAFIGFGSLPLNLAGLLLVGLAILLFVLELTVTSHGLLTVGGIICLVLGASALYTEPGSPTGPDVSVALPLLVVTTLTTAAFMALVVWAAVQARREMPSPGTVQPGMPIGAGGVVRRPLEPRGSVYAAGEEWSALSADGATVARGTPVTIVGSDGLTVVVAPISAATSASADTEVSASPEAPTLPYERPIGRPGPSARISRTP